MSGFGADAFDFLDTRDVFGENSVGDVVGGHGGEHNEGGVGPYAGYTDEVSEHFAFFFGGKTVQNVGIFPHDEFGVQDNGFCIG